MTQFEFNLPMEELEMRTDKEHLMTKKMLKADAPEYLEPVSYTHLDVYKRQL